MCCNIESVSMNLQLQCRPRAHSLIDVLNLNSAHDRTSRSWISQLITSPIFGNSVRVLDLL